jgi:protein-S-isoprenylcysteine O-methyltransferase Ste14
MYPVLIWMYTRLAKSEEIDTRAAFGEKFDVYAKRVGICWWFTQSTRL